MSDRIDDGTSRATAGHAGEKDPQTPDRASGNGRLADVWISLSRWLHKTSRNPFVTFTSLVQPVIFFVLFVEVFGVVADDAITRSYGSEVGYVTYLTPAIVVQSALAAAGTSGIGLVDDMETGMFDKTLVSPMYRGAMFLGKGLSEIVRIAVQTLLVVGLGYAMVHLDPTLRAGAYLQTGLPGVIGVVFLAVLFGGVFMAFSNVVALVTRDREATILLANLLTFPMLFVSSAFLPLSVLPDWIRTVAVANPVTYAVDGIRAVLLGRDVMTVLDVAIAPGLWNTVVPAVAVLLGFAVVLGTLAVHLLERAASADVQ